MRRRPPSSTRTDTLCPDTTLVRSLAGLPPGTYRVDVTADGQTSSQTLTLAVGQTVTLNLGLGGVPETGPAGEATDLDTVVVTAPAMVETKTSEVATRSEEHTSELQSLMRISYAVFCVQKKNNKDK